METFFEALGWFLKKVKFLLILAFILIFFWGLYKVFVIASDRQKEVDCYKAQRYAVEYPRGNYSEMVIPCSDIGIEIIEVGLETAKIPAPKNIERCRELQKQGYAIDCVGIELDFLK